MTNFVHNLYILSDLILSFPLVWEAPTNGNKVYFFGKANKCNLKDTIINQIYSWRVLNDFIVKYFCLFFCSDQR